MSWKNFVKDYLRFGKMGRIGLLSLLALGMLVYLLPLFFKKKSLEFSVQERAVLASATSQDSSSGSKNGSFSNEEAGNEYQKSVYEPGTKNFQAGELFSFDPNTLNIEGWRRLGLTERTARTIGKYISKGGHFYKAEDLKKIWGLPPEFYERVRRYITIAPAPNQYSSYQKPAYDK